MLKINVKKSKRNFKIYYKYREIEKAEIRLFKFN